MKKQLFLSLFTIATVFIFSGCGHEVRNINAGYVGKLLTPTGYDNSILEAGQVDLGVKGDNDQYTSLVLLEASSITIKEEFHQADGAADGEDHRVMTLNKTPLTVDIRVQMSLPKDDKLRNVAFNSVTPTPVSGDNRLSSITLQDIYNKTASMIIRGKVRGIFAKYASYEEVMKNFDKVNAEIAEMVQDVFKSNNTPLEILNVQLSNVKEDKLIWESRNKQEAASATVKSIEDIGEAIRKNPDYIQARKWDVIEKLVSNPNSPNITLVISDDREGAKPMLTIPTTTKAALPAQAPVNK